MAGTEEGYILVEDNHGRHTGLVRAMDGVDVVDIEGRKRPIVDDVRNGDDE